MSDIRGVMERQQRAPLNSALGNPTLPGLANNDVNAQSDNAGVKISMPVIPDALYGKEEELECRLFVGANPIYFGFMVVPNYTTPVVAKKGIRTEITAMPGSFADAVRCFRKHSTFVNGSATLFYRLDLPYFRSEPLLITLDFPTDL